MHNSMRLRSWIAANTVPLIVGGFYGVLWAIQLIPPHVDYFAWQRWALAVAVALSWWALLGALLLVGALAFVLVISAFLLDKLVNVGALDSIMLVLVYPGFTGKKWFIALWVLLALWCIWQATAFVTSVWRADSHWKVGCWLVPLSVVVGYAGLALGPATAVTVDSTCDYTVNSDNRLRFTLFRDNSSVPEYLFVEHRTAGEDWRQTAYVHDHVREDTGCARVDSLERDLVWFWTDNVAMVSQNGGESWYRHEVESDWLLYSGIKDVTFRDVQHGRMTIVRAEVEYGWDEIYRTTDGGQTWTRAE